MGRLNDAPEACHVTETVRVTCYGNFEGGHSKGAVLPPSQSVPCRTAIFTAGGRVLPSAALAMRGRCPRPRLGLALAIGRTAHHVLSPETGMSPAGGGHHLGVE